MRYFVYILRSRANRTYYVGATRNLRQRLNKHNSGGSLFTRSRRPWDLVYVEDRPTMPEALARERAIKHRKSREYIEGLIRSHPVDANAQMT